MTSNTHQAEESRQKLDALLERISNNSGAIGEFLTTIEYLSSSGTLAAVNSIFGEFDEHFSAINKPDFMTMVANGMMLLGTLSELSYEPFFNTAMAVPKVMNTAYADFRDQSHTPSLKETVALLRSPELRAALRLIVMVLRAQREGV